MTILLTNDDGIHAEGINALFETLSGDFDVYMFAPDKQKSACSNALTISTELRVDKINSKKFAVHGFPADCVNIGVHTDLCPEVDLVVSGINHGPNLGDDIHYSGTVAGARSGVIFGKHGIAVSINTYEKPQYLKDCAEYIRKIIHNRICRNEEYPVLININYPDMPSGQIAGVKYTRQGRRSYIDNYSVTEETDDHIKFSLQGEVVSDFSENTDTAEITKNYITITPLQLDSTNYKLLHKCNEK